MKKIMAFFACLLITAGWSSLTRAGVVLDEQVTATRSGKPETQTRQVMVQGHKEKMVGSTSSFVIDLDSGTMTLLNPSQKSYLQMPFPPSKMSGQQLDLNLKKTGKTEKALDYTCDEYQGGFQSPTASVRTVGCFSTSAPGAAEFTEFTRAMGVKLNDAKAIGGNMPSGIPLMMESTREVKPENLSMPGFSSEQMSRLKQMIAKQGPQSTKTVVTRIETRKLPDDTFTVPAGYQRRELPTRAGGPPPAAAGGGNPSGSKVPE
jgi:hypothetical protein